jgi:hypothetical protein
MAFIPKKLEINEMKDAYYVIRHKKTRKPITNVVKTLSFKISETSDYILKTIELLRLFQLDEKEVLTSNIKDFTDNLEIVRINYNVLQNIKMKSL